MKKFFKKIARCLSKENGSKKPKQIIRGNVIINLYKPTTPRPGPGPRIKFKK